MPRVIHFEIPAKDLDRVARFYTDVFGWKVEKWSGPVDYWLVTTGNKREPGIDGAISRQTPGGTTCNTISVPSVDEFIAKVEAAGGKAITQKMAIPSVGYDAVCMDPEGNCFGIMEHDPNAA